ncbi:hypothetical protein MASR1M31_13270 [Porphyromonadaceae bacterium]
MADELKRSGAKERYVWTAADRNLYILQNGALFKVERLIKAIEAGDIVWNAMPYTLESETMNRELFETIMSLSNQLDDPLEKLPRCQDDRCAGAYQKYCSTACQSRG